MDTISNPKIFAAISAVMSEIGPISKDRKNTQQGYAFRGVDDAMNALNPVMSKNKIFPVITAITPVVFNEVTSKNGGLGYHTVRLYTIRLYAEDGSFIEGQMEGQAIDYGDKSITKSQSVAYREFLYKTFVVPLEQSEDIENQSHELKKPTEVLPVEKPFFGKPQFEQLSNEIKQGIVNEENVDGIKKKIFANYTIAPEWISSLKNLFDGGVMKVSKEVVETAEIPEKTKLEEVLEQVEAIKEKKVLTAEEVENLDF